MHWGVGFWPLFPLFWVGMVLFFCWSACRWFGWRYRRGPFYTPGNEPVEPGALEILCRRYARGEIDSATFDRMRERLESVGRPRD